MHRSEHIHSLRDKSRTSIDREIPSKMMELWFGRMHVSRMMRQAGSGNEMKVGDCDGRQMNEEGAEEKVGGG